MDCPNKPGNDGGGVPLSRLTIVITGLVPVIPLIA